MQSTIKVAGQSLSLPGLLNLFVVYTVWSSTYLAIRIAVRPGSGFTPFAMGALRMLIAGLILLGLAYVQKQRIIPTATELFRLAVSGIFLWVGGNGLVNWAEQVADSSFAALMVSSSPIVVAIINAILNRQRPSTWLMGSLFLGFGGLSVLSVPSILKGNPLELYSTLALFCVPVLWACGSVLQTRRPVELHVMVSSAYQHLCACVAFTLIALIRGEPFPHPTTEAFWAWSYLVIFGSVWSFTSYISSLRLLPIHIAMTYAYVNPVFALFLGWFILDEPITVWTLLGTALVVIGVMGVFRQRSPQLTQAKNH